MARAQRNDEDLADGVSAPRLTTQVALILDQSGSMQPLRGRTIAGVNEYLSGLRLRSDEIAYLVTLHLFADGNTAQPYTLAPLADVADLTERTYRPGGGTPLYDSACDVLDQAEGPARAPGVAALAVIVTDGEENMSRRRTERDLAERIARLTAAGNWTFAFLGANQDAFAAATRYGIPVANARSWEATDQGTTRAFATLATASADYSRTMSQAYVASGGRAGGYSTLDFFNGSTPIDPLDAAAGPAAVTFVADPPLPPDERLDWARSRIAARRRREGKPIP